MKDDILVSPFEPEISQDADYAPSKPLSKSPTSNAEGMSSVKDAKDYSNDRRIIRTVRSFMTKSKTYREDYLDWAENARRQYKNWEIETRSKIKRANLQPSYGFQIIETLLPQLCDIFFGDNHIVQFKGRERSDFDYTDTLSDFFDIQFADMDLELKSYSFIKSMLMDGTAIAKVPYRYQEQLITRRQVSQDPNDPTGIQKTSQIEIVYDGPDFELVPLYDFFPDWRVKEPGNIKKMRGCVHRMFKGFSELKGLEEKTGPDGKKSGVYKNLDELKFSLQSKGQEAWLGTYWEDAHRRAMQQIDNRKQNVKDNDGIELWEYWGLFDLEGDGNLQECLITVANGDTVIRAVPNFYDYKIKPFVACVNYIRSNEFYGVPELLAVDAEIREAKALRNARLDQVNLAVNTMWLVDRTAGIDSKNMYSRPGGIIFTNDMNGVKPLSVGDPAASAMQELQYIDSNISQTSSIGSPPIVGSSKSFARSATGVNFVQQFATSRLGLKAKLLSKLFFNEVTHIMMMTDRQFVTEEQWVRVSDPNSPSPNPFQMLPQDAFFKNYDFIFRTKPDESDEVRTQKMQSVAQIMQVAEQSQPGVTKMDVVLEALLRPILGTEVKRFMRTEEEMQQLKMQNMQMRIQEQAANAQIGANAPQPNANPLTTGGPINAR